MAKFIVGVLVGLFLGASATAYGAVATGSGTLSSRTVAKNSEAVIISDRPVSAGWTSKS
jgi:hypothetical protein